MKKYKIFIACDTRNVDKVKKIIKLSENSKLKIGYKFGLEFVNSKLGRKFISKLYKKIIFLDLKLNDIPNTCASAIKAVKDLKAGYITIHINSGLEALKKAKKVCGNIKLVGVTTLTSLDNKSLKQLGYKNSIEKVVYEQAKLANKARLDAIVCSAKETRMVKKVFKKEIITPGIRILKDKNDQKRVISPCQAFKNGSNWLVIGRPITKGNISYNLNKLIDHLEK
tara:strand:+ start:52 stop:726 length:675 start_codon:yes stop_codon:yes gene_type:complete